MKLPGTLFLLSFITSSHAFGTHNLMHKTTALGSTIESIENAEFTKLDTDCADSMEYIIQEETPRFSSPAEYENLIPL
jgi:hypothetical protein